MQEIKKIDKKEAYMKRIIVDGKTNNKKIIQIIQNKYPKCALGTIHRALRNKDIKVNGKRIKDNMSVFEGDELEVFISDELLLGKNEGYKIEKSRIRFEDDNLLIYNKPQEIEVQGKSGEDGLEEALQNQFGKSIKACHRLDRNTAGLVIFAKNKESESIMLKMIKDRVVKKYYRTLVYGIPKNKKMTLNAYLFKDSKKSTVVISDVPKKGYQEIITKYELLDSDKKNNTSLLEVELITGKTHQIRAHLAHIGFPIIGDGKYGINQINKQFGKKYQELESYKIVFEDAYDELDYLKGKEVKIR